MVTTALLEREVPKGKRLLFTDSVEVNREFHGPCTVLEQYMTAKPVELVDELSPILDTRSDYERLSLEQKFEALRAHLKVTLDQITNLVEV